MPIQIETRTYYGEIAQTRLLKPGDKIVIHDGIIYEENTCVFLGKPKIVTVKSNDSVSYTADEDGYKDRKITLVGNAINKFDLSFSPLPGNHKYISSIVYDVYERK